MDTLSWWHDGSKLGLLLQANLTLLIVATTINIARKGAIWPGIFAFVVFLTLVSDPVRHSITYRGFEWFYEGNAPTQKAP
jgi:Kef-type K+ transport system membrane component KefB